MQWPGIFKEVAGHPVILLRAGHIFDSLTPVAAIEIRSAHTRGADVTDSKSLIVSHGHNGRLAITRVTGNADLFRVDRFVGLKVVERPARAPGPGTQRAPVIRLAKLAFVTESDDAFFQTSSVVRLHRRRNQLGITPAL